MDRRGLLAAGAAGGLALAGCGARSRTAPGRGDDVAVLNGLLELELASVAAYERGGFALARRLAAHEREHAARLRQAVRALGGEPSTRARPRVDGSGGLALALRVEETSVAAYLDALPRLGDDAVRGTLAGVLATEAEHLAAVRGAVGEPPADQAFVTARRSL